MQREHKRKETDYANEKALKKKMPIKNHKISSN